jgi:hypothetical protein
VSAATRDEPLFAPAGEGLWRPAQHARGPWADDQLHGGAPAALLAGLIEAHEPGAGMVVARLAIELFSAVPMADLRLRGPTIVKPGGRFQVVEAALEAGGRTVVVARAVRLRRAELDVSPAASQARGSPAGEPHEPPIPPPSAGRGNPGFAPVAGRAFHPTAVEVRFVGGAPGSGAARAWFRLRCPVVAGEDPTPLQRVAAAADFGNGISHALPFADYLFVNCDLTIHLHREAEGEWVALDARTDVSDLGVAQASSVLHDAGGRIGIAAQSLFVAPR